MMRAARFAVRGMAVVAALGVASGVASAQINPFRTRGADRMTNEDIRLSSEATTRLLAHDPLVMGATETWKNPRTGAHGSARVGKELTLHGYACRQVQYSGQTGRGVGQRSGELNWCKTPDGWKVAS